MRSFELRHGVVELEQIEIVEIRQEAPRSDIDVALRREASEAVVVGGCAAGLWNSRNSILGIKRLSEGYIELRLHPRIAEAKLVIKAGAERFRVAGDNAVVGHVGDRTQTAIGRKRQR